MSNKHLTAAFNCKEFTGTTRLLLVVLADSASNGESVNVKRNLPFGYTSMSLLTMMRRVNTKRPHTISDALKELRLAGAIKTIHRKQKAALTVVNLEYLENQAWTDSDRSRQALDNPYLTSTHAAKRQGLMTQSDQACAKSMTQNDKASCRKTTSYPVLSHTVNSESQKLPASIDDFPAALQGKNDESLRSLTPTPTPKATPPVTRPEPEFSKPCYICDPKPSNKGKLCNWHKDFVVRIKSCPDCEHLEKGKTRTCSQHTNEGHDYLEMGA
jgi:hypothetical protein